MTKNPLVLRAVEKLLGESFYVPRYQRGYRWDPTQVVELLSDVWEFIRKPTSEFYCLQPVVVAPRDGAWELVDGQQRLTTLFLILSFFNERLTLPYRRKLYSIEYETRPNSAAFLSDPQPGQANENIDFFHMVAASKAIRTWFSDKMSHVSDVESAFLLRVQVIWYELGPDAKPVEVFQRLNIGKIPLTEDELVKALFLRASNFPGEDRRLLQLQQLQIAQEWDTMERRLQEDNFWYFLTNQHRGSNRIAFLLELYATTIRRANDHPWQGTDIFHTVAQRLSEPGAKAWLEWQQVKGIFSALDEWFRDDTLHHLVGFLASRESTEPHAAIRAVTELASSAANKREFRKSLKKDIFSRIFYGGQSKQVDFSVIDLPSVIRQKIGELDYSSDRAVIRNVLLLFNLASILESSAGTRFPFGAFKREAWDIEHIRSVQSRMPQRVDEQKRWLVLFMEYLSGVAMPGAVPSEERYKDQKNFIEKAQALLNAEKFDSEAFSAYFSLVQRTYDPYQSPESDNSIGNLTLLDAATNRGYGNAIFPIKRKMIIGLDKKGQFVPLCTKNAFLKYYSRHLDQMLVWSKADADAYANAICEQLTAFFKDAA